MSPQTSQIYTENNDFQHLEALSRNRVKRLRHRQVFVEGVLAINQLVENKWPLDAFIYSRDQRLSDWATHLLKTSSAKTHYELPAHLMAKLSQKEEPSELLAIAQMPADDLDRIPLNPTALVVILDRPTNPGNLGTILRSADAFGVNGIIITGHAVDPYEPKTIRASRGCLFSVPLVRVETNQALTDWLHALKAQFPTSQIVGTSAKAETNIASHAFSHPTILMMGNETTGLRKAYQALCDTLVKIPMSGSASSLNVAVATSIFLYEVNKMQP